MYEATHTKKKLRLPGTFLCYVPVLVARGRVHALYDRVVQANGAEEGETTDSKESPHPCQVKFEEVTISLQYSARLDF
jgi:hypothetical protein